jgi:hypothetical protein
MVKIKKVPYGGWANCYEVTNGDVRLIVTSDVGPRVLFYGFIDGQNHFYTNPKEAGISGDNQWHSYGGHRLWHAPEDPIRTYVPDNFPVKVDVLENGLRLTSPIEVNGIQKIIEIHLAPTGTEVTVLHTLLNTSQWGISFAPWALSVMRQGGVAIIPQSKRKEFPSQLTPTHSITLWSYARMSDPRWTWGDRTIFLRQDPSIEKPQKFGIYNTEGWAAYWNDQQLFIKSFHVSNTQRYPDMNCNFEAFTNNEILELETLGPLETVLPGGHLDHVENWSIFKDVQKPVSDDDVDRIILPLLQK